MADGAFAREYGCTEAEWLRWLPGAVRDHMLSLPAPGQACVAIGSGRLALSWTVLPPRRIALVSLARMKVEFSFEGVDDAARAAFLRYFDLYLQRGGG